MKVGREKDVLQDQRISNSQPFDQIGVIPSGFEAFAFDAAFERSLLFEQIGRDMVEQEKFCAELPARLQLCSSPKATSSNQCSLFSMLQC